MKILILNWCEHNNYLHDSDVQRLVRCNGYKLFNFVRGELNKSL